MSDGFKEIQGPVVWSDLKSHCERKALYWVMNGLDLSIVFEAVVKDDAESVKKWLKDGLIKQATMADGETFEQSGSEFDFVIASPYVLAKLKVH